MFSVVIPLYNKEATIANTLSSVLNQTFDNFEIIVVDDGSTDLSLKIAKVFTDSRIKVFAKAHEGVSETRNFGIKKANHEYIAFLDADDFWEPGYLTEMAALIRKYTDCAMFSSAYKVIGQNKISVKCTSIPEGVIEDIFKVRLHHRIMRLSATVVQKAVFDDVGGFPTGMIGGEDEYVWAKIAIKYKVAFTPKVLAYYDNRYSCFLSRKGKMDSCKESWFDLYKEGEFYRNEFIAYKAITAGIRYAYGASQDKSVEIERQAQYTELFKKNWQNLFFLNRMPKSTVYFIKQLWPLYKSFRSFCFRFIKKPKQNKNKMPVTKIIESSLLKVPTLL